MINQKITRLFNRNISDKSEDYEVVIKSFMEVRTYGGGVGGQNFVKKLHIS
jgi:hypothetical protein